MLAVGASCSVVVTFSGATTAGAKIRISYVDGAGHNPEATRDVIGTHASNAVVVVTECEDCGVDSRPADFGTVGTSSTRWFTVRNNGALTAAMLRDAGLLGGGFAFAGGNYPGTNGSCSNTLAPGMSCQVTVTFTPPGPGARGHAGRRLRRRHRHDRDRDARPHRMQTNLALLKVHDWSENDNGGGDFYDLGTIGVPVDHTFTITNDGAQPATLMTDGGGLGSGFSWKGGNYPGTGGTCLATLSSGGHCTVVVRFTPSGSGTRTSQLLIFYYDGANTQYAKRALSATATNRALLQITDWNIPEAERPRPAALRLRHDGQRGEHTFTVTNRGAVPATLIADGGTLGGGFGWTGSAFGGGTCGAMLGVGRQLHAQRDVHAGGRRGAHEHAFALLQRRRHDPGRGARAHRHGDDEGAAERLRLERAERARWPGRQRPAVRLRRLGCPRRSRVHRPQRRRRPRDDGRQRRLDGDGLRLEGRQLPGTGGDCGAMLAVGATCKLVVTFTPSGRATLFGQVGSRTTTAPPPAPRSAR